jgi:diguanylate cyclase (GGDEF)-like protein
MSHAVSGHRLPRWSLTRWLVDPGKDVPCQIRQSMFDGLYGTVPIFLGGVFNSLLVATVIALRHPEPLFIAWAVGELLLAMIRLPVVLSGIRAIRNKTEGPSDLYILLAVLWAAGIGYGAFISMLSGDWVVATLACLSAAAMVGGICFRNFAAPRLVAIMILLTLGPCVVAGFLSGEWIMMVTALQIPAYLFAMAMAAFRMNRMLVERMQAELDQDRRARHDDLTGLTNRSGLASELALRAEMRDLAPVAYFFLDLDGFKRVNDSLGHAAGDGILVDVSARLRSILSRQDIAARIGGDEFLVVSPCDDRTRAQELGQAVIRALSEKPYLIGEQGVEIAVSIGIALSQEHGPLFTDLIEAADRALYQAKAAGRSRLVIANRGPRLATDKGRRSECNVRSAAMAAAG